ncbi:Pimeloyl-ACP methyl ester carboxylesterase [Brevibacterium siliguriense]|uniref:Pimeloyl-ACP methyl ester carboxylesterase n=1 Tax=Brevibacterium siliguriense TaxID=1136497 RepID=A0A1H1UPP9_9MICO|nr:alpha/beta hydrolase [Brevibacterium siliguriense]SDS74443.1 Pimeloyl-ACP methyl ester carboxylesterase [Brevibacterium siliguriense]
MRTRESQRIDLRLESHRTAAWLYPGDRSQRPLLMVHGFRGDHHGMDLIAGSITDREVVVPDLPGFGLTAPLESGSSLPAFVDYLLALRAEVGRQRGATPILVGHSFGSILVSHLVATHRDLVDELVLINPITSPALEGPARFLTAVTRAYYALGARLPERAGRALLSNLLIVRAMSVAMATTRDPGLRRYIHDQHGRHFSSFADRQSLSEAFATSVAHTVTEVADHLTMPTLVIAGDKDAIAPIGPTRAFVAELSDAEFVELGGVGHLVHYERSVEAASAIMEFCHQRIDER